MLPKRLGALHVLKPLSKGPSLVRYKNYKADITQDRWPTGLTPEARPYSGTWKPPHRNYFVPFTIYNVPNNSEAYVRWPTLRNFKPTLNPRAWKTVKPGGSYAAQLDSVKRGPTREARAEKQLALMPYMYHDLGVLIYEGPTEKQLRTIAHMLKRLAKHEGRLQARAWNATEQKVRFDKWNVYRLSVDEKNHIDKFLRERGYLLPSGLDELTDTVLQKWRDDWKARREAEGRDGRLPVRFVKDTKEMWLLKNQDGMGLVNETINGPRITSVDAYVATAVLKQRIHVNIELHTVGTKRFLGCASFQFEPTIDHTIEVKRPKEVKEIDNASLDAESQALKRREQRQEVRRHLRQIYSHEAPASIERHEPIVNDLTKKLWRLERLIWKDKVDAQKKEMQEYRMLEWKRQKELRRSVKAQAKADKEGIEKPPKEEKEI